MYCPHCGQREMTAIARFCPSCGLALSKVKDLLNESTLGSTRKETPDSMQTETITFSVPTPIEDIEREMILSTLKKTDGNKTHAAELLKISLKTLHNKLHVYRQNKIAS
jgi:DNA-binding NtrC family response regulator